MDNAILIINLGESLAQPEAAAALPGDEHYDRLQDAIRNQDFDQVRALTRNSRRLRLGPGVARMNASQRRRSGCEYIVAGPRYLSRDDETAWVMLSPEQAQQVAEKVRLFEDLKTGIIGEEVFEGEL